eukprot:1190575-Prorocentrum_minimum.AAC.6
MGYPATHQIHDALLEQEGGKIRRCLLRRVALEHGNDLGIPNNTHNCLNTPHTDTQKKVERFARLTNGKDALHTACTSSLRTARLRIDALRCARGSTTRLCPAFADECRAAKPRAAPRTDAALLPRAEARAVTSPFRTIRADIVKLCA